VKLSQDLVMPRVRCAAVHGSTGADPAGSAPNWDAIVVVEVPLPWPKDITSAPPFSSFAGEPGGILLGPDGRRWRPQGVVPREGDGGGPAEGEPPSGVRVMAFERSPEGGGTPDDGRTPDGGRAPGDDGRAGPFQRREWCVPDLDAAAALVAALLGAEPDAVRAFAEHRDDPDPCTVDLLVCTHGTRDVCCGGTGAAVLSELVGALGGEEVGGLRVWRTSHAGGHRFAATAVSLPDGTAWAHLGADVAAAVLRRDRPAGEVAPHCRGAVTLEGAVAQVADREGLRRHGWRWLDQDRVATVVAHERDTLATTVEVLAEDGTGVRVRVELDRHIPMPTCGVVEGPEFTTEPVWKAAEVDEIGGSGG
jgi:hypothetical protein